MKKVVIIFTIFVLAVLGYVFRDDIKRTLFFSPNLEDESSEIVTEDNQEEAGESIQVVATGLDIPWGIEFLPNGDLLITERVGELTRLSSDGQVIENIDIEGVNATGEGGLLGIALHPDFSVNRWLYLYQTYETDGGTNNRVMRYEYRDGKLSNSEVVIADIPGAFYHDGGRIKFGPDERFYITTGDAGSPQLAQSQDSLAGKILRLQDDGMIPTDNPFDNSVLSLGHRNPQGITWGADGELWSTEHGRSGLRSGFDEINLIEPGSNYGWPEIQGDETTAELRSPVTHSGPNTTWAPASAQYYNGSIFFGGLRGEALFEAVLNESETEIIEVITHFSGEFGRIRSVTLGSDEQFFYLSTSNTDGRGNPREGDDKIIRVDVDMFQ